MTKTLAATLAATAFLGLSGAAFAQTHNNAQTSEARYGFTHISTNRLAAAEARLIAQRQAEPKEPSVLLNLAYVYAKTDRLAAASALYGDVLTLPNVRMELGSGKPAWSHDIAKRGLSRNAVMAAR